MNPPPNPFKAVLARAVLLLCLGSSAQSNEYSVSITDTTYVPNYLEIQPGDTVWWTNDDPFGDPHSSTSNQGYWNSGTVYYGYTVGITFPIEGTFPYHDTYFGYQGTIVVTQVPEPSGLSLLSLGLIVFATYRWLPRHRQGLRIRATLLAHDHPPHRHPQRSQTR